MSTAGKMKRRVGVKLRRGALAITNDPEWASFQAIARKVDQGWRHFWRKRGVVMSEHGMRDFDFRAISRAQKRHGADT